MWQDRGFCVTTRARVFWTRWRRARCSKSCSDRILSELTCPRRASVSIPDANMTHAHFSCSYRILSESRFPRRASVSIPDANITHAPSSCSDRILSGLRCPRRASVSIPDAHMTHAPSPARTGFCQNNNKMSEARVGQYTRCKYDACSKSCLQWTGFCQN